MPLHLSKEGVVRKGNAKALGAFSSNEGTKMYYNNNEKKAHDNSIPISVKGGLLIYFNCCKLAIAIILSYASLNTKRFGWIVTSFK